MEEIIFKILQALANIASICRLIWDIWRSRKHDESDDVGR